MNIVILKYIIIIVGLVLWIHLLVGSCFRSDVGQQEGQQEWSGRVKYCDLTWCHKGMVRQGQVL